MIDNNFNKHDDPLPLIKRDKIKFQSIINRIQLTTIFVLFIAMGLISLITIKLFPDISLKSIGIESILITTCTICIYMLSMQYSERKGTETTSYINAESDVDGNSEIIVDKGYTKYLTDYTNDWIKSELDLSRKEILDFVNISVDEFKEKYLKYSIKEIKEMYQLTELELKAISAAKKLKPLKYNSQYLISNIYQHSHRISPSGGLTTKYIGLIQRIKVIFSSIISTLFTVSITGDIIADISYSTIVLCVIKIVTVLIFGVIGMIKGYQRSAIKGCEELKLKSTEQKKFIRYCELKAASEI